MKKYTKIICVLDKSGSMSSIIDDSIGGFNSFLKSQKELDGNATMRIHMFDSDYETVVNDKDIQDIEELTRKTYVPGSSTALYDAIGFTIYDELNWLGSTKNEERPEKTLFIILTDGQENSSRKFKKNQIKELIEECRKELNWEFIYLGANQDACFVAESMGMSRGNSYTYDYSSKGTTDAYSTLNVAVSSYRKSKENETDNLIC